MPINMLNADNRDWKTNVSVEKEIIKQLNLSGVDKRDWQINVNMRKKKKMQLSLLNVGKRDYKHIKSIEKNISYG